MTSATGFGEELLVDAVDQGEVVDVGEQNGHFCQVLAVKKCHYNLYVSSLTFNPDPAAIKTSFKLANDCLDSSLTPPLTMLIVQGSKPSWPLT